MRMRVHRVREGKSYDSLSAPGLDEGEPQDFMMKMSIRGTEYSLGRKTQGALLIPA
jgi:hypothetical protein